MQCVILSRAEDSKKQIILPQGETKPFPTGPQQIRETAFVFISRFSVTHGVDSLGKKKAWRRYAHVFTTAAGRKIGCRFCALGMLCFSEMEVLCGP